METVNAMIKLDDRQLTILRQHVQLCGFALQIGAELHVKRSWFGIRKPTNEQRAWYLGFVSAWAGDICQQNGIEYEAMGGFTFAVFEVLFGRSGARQYKLALAQTERDGPLTQIGICAENSYKNWDKGRLVPCPPTR
jgi:hypothetical protein